MGGVGSTRWNDHNKKRTTEECFILDVGSLTHNEERSGVLRPVKISGQKSVLRVHYSLELSETHPILGINYVHDRSAEGTTEQRVRLCSTKPGFGGERPWFVCPLRKEDGSPCGRRVGKLYLPPEEERFGCRHCHDLAYRSSQKCGYYDGMCRLVTGEEGEMFEFLKRAFQDGAREARNHALKNPPLTLVEVFDRKFGDVP